MALLKVDNLTTRFYTREGVTTAVDGMSYQVERGETLGIVGESGSGKSVSCYSLLNLIPQPPGRIDSGSALFDGIDLLSCPEKQLRSLRGNRIGMIFQDPMTSLNPYLTVGTQLFEPLRFHKMLSKREARLHAIRALEEVGIDDGEKRLNSYPHEFSGGMRQRVMIAMALMTEPDLLIADEPTTALDVTIQAQILALIKDIQERHNIAVIFITHDLGVVAKIADRVLVMNKGQVVEQGDTNAIFHAPQDEYTRTLLNAIPASAKPDEYRFSNIGNSTALEIDNLSISYAERSASPFSKGANVQVVRKVALSLAEGEILGLVGESGCGKSTLSKSVVRLVEEDQGSIVFEGRDITGLDQASFKEMRKHIQMIFQDPYASLNPRMSVFDILSEPLRVHGIASGSAIGQRVISLMEEVGLTAKDIRKYPHEFSGGQRQRIAIARALAVEPKVIIADEPVSALDVTIQAQILKLLLQLVQKYRLSMIFISHDLSVVRYVADRVAVMYQGEIIEVDSTEVLFKSPREAYTRKLLSAVPVADPSAYELQKS